MDDLSTPKGTYEHLDEITLVDCREPYEWEAGRVDGAVHIPLNRMPTLAIIRLERIIYRPMRLVTILL